MMTVIQLLTVCPRIHMQCLRILSACFPFIFLPSLLLFCFFSHISFFTIYHTSVTCGSMPPATDKSFLKKSTVRQTVHIIILCNWLPFYRPCSFASQTFVCFANYFLLQLSQKANFITSQYLTMCEQNFTTLIFEKIKKRTADICIGIYSNCSPASAKVIFVYIFNDITDIYICHGKVC